MVSPRLSSLVSEAEHARSSAEAAMSVAEELGSLLREELGGETPEEFRAAGGVRLLEEIRSLMIVGDIHGDLDTLVAVLSRARALDRLGGKGFLLVFLGDYIDRGPAQIEVLALLTRIKSISPGRVIMLRGNHEPPPGLTPYPHDFPLQLLSLYGEEGRKIYGKFHEAFQLMPYAAFGKKILLMHGGLPTRNYRSARTLEEYLEAGAKPSPELLEEVLWNDPDEFVEEWAPSPRGAGRLFGRRVTEQVCRMLGCSLVVRGHEPCMNGYKYNHGGRVLTLFSRLGPPYMNSRAAYALLGLTGEKPEIRVETIGF